MNTLERYAKRQKITTLHAFFNLALEAYGTIDDSFIGYWLIWKRENRLPDKMGDLLKAKLRR